MEIKGNVYAERYMFELNKNFLKIKKIIKIKKY